MISTLLGKEIACRFKSTSSVKSRVLQWLAILVGTALVVAVVVFMTDSLDGKMSSSDSSSTPYLITLFLFVFAAFNCVDGALKLRKSVFSDEDREIITCLPFKPFQVVLSKALTIYFIELCENAVLSLPVLIVYGVNRGADAGFYVTALVYCLVVSLFAFGLSMVLAVVFQAFYHLIKGVSLAQFILASLVVVGLCFLYYYFLKLFLVSLDGSTDIDGALPQSFLDNMASITQWMVPVYSFISMWLLGTGYFQGSMILVVGILVLVFGGFGILLAGYRARDRREGGHTRRQSYRVHSPFWNLVRKEEILIFKDSPSIFSYTTLLVMMPFLSAVVISAFNQILGSNLSIVLTYYPRFLEVTDMTLVLIFISIINSAASLSISREGKGWITYRTLPYSPILTIGSKVLVCSFLSTLSLAITCIVLGAMGYVDWQVALTSFFGGFLLVVSENFVGILIDIHDRSESGVKLSFLASLLPILDPLICGLIGFLVMFYARLSWAIFLSFFASCLVISAIPAAFIPRVGKMLENMEV